MSTQTPSSKPLSKNVHLQRWVAKMAALCKPDRIHWVDGSKAEYDRLYPPEPEEVAGLLLCQVRSDRRRACRGAHLHLQQF